MMPSVIAGGVRPAIRVGGISRSGTSLRNLSHVVVVAKLPMPSVSKKLTTAPRPMASRVGQALRAITARRRIAT